MEFTEPHHRTALHAVVAAVALVVVLGPVGLLVGGLLLVGVGLTLPRESASRLALLLFGGTPLVLLVLGLLLFGLGGEVQSGGSVIER